MSFNEPSSAFQQTKKKAPPRPPQPATNTTTFVKASQSFASGNDLRKLRIDRSLSLRDQPIVSSDLIDFNHSSKPLLITAPQSQVQDFKYRVGASIFYVKSELKNPGYAKIDPMPFSPPRPSAQAILQSSGSKSTHNETIPVKHPSQPTIIKSDTGGNKQNKPILLEWDEPPQLITKPIPSANTASAFPTPLQPTLSKTNPKPTILRPKPTIIKPKPSPAAIAAKRAQNTTSSPPPPPQSIVPLSSQKPSLYDHPPSEDSDDEDANDSYISPPMPDMPPPPPPQDIHKEWPTSLPNYHAGEYPPMNMRVEDLNRPYALVLYDFAPEADGDLTLQAGDLVYLLKNVDESWAHGSCGGNEGLFPLNHVQVVVPLEGNEYVDYTTIPLPLPPNSGSSGSTSNPNSPPNSTSPLPLQTPPDGSQTDYRHYTQVLYTFSAETDTDLSLEAGDIVTVMGRLNEDWLWGEMNGIVGQFPASFCDSVPIDIPTINNK